MSEFKPMLASQFEGSTIEYPVLASPKIDGYRCLIIGGQALTRSLKPIPNNYVRDLLSDKLLENLDGELIYGSATDPASCRSTGSAVMSHDGEPKVTFHVFDDFTYPHDVFTDRIDSATTRVGTLQNYYPAKLRAVPHVAILDYDQLLKFEEECLTKGYEGIMLRNPYAPYKCGRSTPKQGWLVKKKNFVDSEMRITEFQELMHNDNEANTNELGNTFRSKEKEGLRGGNTLGALLGEDVHTGQAVKLGTGFTAEQRQEIWYVRESLVGSIAKYKKFGHGEKDLPRHTVFLGFRPEEDMS